MVPPGRSIHERDVLPVLREFLSQNPGMTQIGYDALSRSLFVLRFLPYRPAPFAVEAALEALMVEGEVLP
jgi:hypothetical protein